MKKIFVGILVLIILISSVGLTSFAADTAEVYVTISDANGQLVMVQEKITVTDSDGDNTLTVRDTLYAAHEAKYEGGADEGFASSQGQYGLQLDKLWGTANGGSYGYYINDVSAMGLGDTVKTGDYIKAYVYTDLTAWSDVYSYFDANTKVVGINEEITLNLSYAGYDASYNPVVAPVANAVITIDGTDTEYRTDDDGNVTIKLDKVGTYTISAKSDTLTLVPPVCVITVSSIADTGDCCFPAWAFVILCTMALSAVVIMKRKCTYEK